MDGEEAPEIMRGGPMTAKPKDRKKLRFSELLRLKKKKKSFLLKCLGICGSR